MSNLKIEAVEVLKGKDVQEYIDRAKEIGLNPYNHYSDGNFIILYYPTKHFNFLHTNFNYPIISQEEFFGEKMRKEIDKDVLRLLVQQSCDSLTSFSSYDVTCILRKRLPSHDILHNEVKPMVEAYVVANNFQVSDNGVYKTYSKPVKTTSCCQVQLPNVITTLNNKKQFSSTTQKTPTKLEQALAKKSPSNLPTTKEYIISLQSEGRINLTDILRKHFDMNTVGFGVSKNPKSIYLNKTSKGFLTFNFDREARLRTKFKGSNVKVVVRDNFVEVKPV